MNAHRGHETQSHFEAKPAIGRKFKSEVWSIFYEQRNADVLILHHTSLFAGAIELESSPKNVLNNIQRNMAYGCQAVAVVSLTDRYLNQIRNKIKKYIDPDNSRPIKVFSYDKNGLQELYEWIEQLALSYGGTNGENR